MKDTALLLIVALLLSGVVFAAEPARQHPANPHYLLFRGKPVVLITSGEHYGAVLNSDFNYRKYLDTLAAAGLNYTRLFTGSYVEPPGAFKIERNDLAPAEGKFLAPWERSKTAGYAGGGNKFDLERFNPKYLSRLKDFIKRAGEKGLAVELTLFTSTYGDPQWRLSPLNRANNVNDTPDIPFKQVTTLDNGNLLGYQEKLVRYLVRELNEYDNLFFEIQNEPWSDHTVTVNVVNPYLKGEVRDKFPNSVDVADDASMKWQAAVAGWIASEESARPNKHLVAQNYANFVASVRELAPGVGIINFHYAYPEAVSMNYGWNKVLSFDESGFAGTADATYRQQAWNFILAGGGIFNNLDYSFSAGHEDGLDSQPTSPGGGSAELRRQLRVLADFMKRFDLLALKPDTETVSGAPGVYARVLATPGKQYAVYVTGQPPANVILELPAGRYRAEWINTKTGAVEKSNTFTHHGGGKMMSAPAFTDDVALAVVANEK